MIFLIYQMVWEIQLMKNIILSGIQISKKDING